MDQYEIKETFDFELQLAQLMLKDEPWDTKFRRLKFTSAKESRADRNGDIVISTTKWQNSRDYQALRLEIRALFVDLHCGFIKRHKFLWQRIAKKLNLIQETTADDLTECELCNKPTQLVRTKRCVDCRRLEQYIKASPDIARRILEKLDDSNM